MTGPPASSQASSLSSVPSTPDSNPLPPLPKIVLAQLALYVLEGLASAPVVRKFLQADSHMDREKLYKMKAVLEADRSVWDDIKAFRAKLKALPDPSTHSPTKPVSETPSKGGPRLATPTPKVAPPADMTMGCFRTTVVVEADETEAWLVRSVLLDTGASASFLQRRCAENMGLNIMSCDPITFTIGNGSKIVRDHRVQFAMWMGGVEGQVKAYVCDEQDKTSLTLGVPALSDYRVAMKVIGAGSERRVKATVSPDVEGRRNLQYLIHCDHLADRPCEILLAAKIGETVVRNEDRLARGKDRLDDYPGEFERQLRRWRVHSW